MIWCGPLLDGVHMAIRHRTGRKKPWEVYWNNPFTLKRESLYTETEEEAKKQDALKKYQIKFERDMFRPEEPCETQENTTLETAYYEYMREKQFSKKGISWQIDSMKKALEIIGDKPITQITAQDLKSVKQALSNQNVAPVTVRNRLSVLRTVLRWCHKNEFMEEMPRFPDLPPATYKHVIPPTDSELSRLWDFSPPHIRRVIVLGAMFGVRVGPSEMFKMTWDDFDFEQKLVRVQAAKKNIMEPWREIPIRENIVSMLIGWREEDSSQGIQHVVHFRSKPVFRIQTAWEKSIKRAGLRRFSPYSLRHKFATDILSAGIDPGTVAKLMGHRTTAMIFSHYQHVITEQKRLAVEALPELSCCGQHVAENMWQKENGLHLLM